MIYIKSPKTSYGVNLPTNITEVTKEALDTITNGIKLPKNYCIVALCFKTKLSRFAISISGKRTDEIGVVPVLAKIYAKDSEKVNANVGDMLIVDRSALERGSHINCETCISANNFRNYLTHDSDMLKAIVTNKTEDYGFDANTTVIILEFKIIPIVEIRAAINNSIKSKDPYLTKDIEGNC